MPRFERYVGVDYSGAQRAETPLTGLRVFVADENAAPAEIRNPQSRSGHWSRDLLARWLADELGSDGLTIAGIDHCFSLPKRHLEKHGLNTWDQVLADIANHWPIETPVRASLPTNPRMGGPTEYRLTDRWCPATKSVFQHRGQGTVFFSTHAGLPWVREIRRALGSRVHFWPFDGFTVPDGRSVVAEVYPAMFKRRYSEAEFATSHQIDAFATCRWLQDRDQHDLLAGYLKPPLTAAERSTARLEGWILGVA